MKKITLFLIAIFLIIPMNGYASDYLHPSGKDIVSTYSISDSVASFGDTILIIRTISNNDIFIINGLTLSDHIHSNFHVINQTVEIGGTPVDYIFSGAHANLVYPGYSTYHWTLDSPVDGEPVSTLLFPGKTLTISYRIVSTDIGNYLFPLHSSSFIDQGQGYFITSDSLQVRVVLSSGIDDPEANDLLPNSIISTAYPNPFNVEVRVLFEGKGIGGQQMEFEIYNVLGQKIHQETITRGTNSGKFHWRTTGVSGSGIYFYQIITASARCRGKLVLVK